MRTNSLPSMVSRVQSQIVHHRRAVIVAAALVFAAMQATAQAATITVTGTGDTIAVDGLVTLREAITSANDNASVNADVVPVGAYGADIINFNIAGGGVKTITPATGLPVITDPVSINGYSQPGASRNTLAIGSDATLLIQITGPADGGPFNAVAGLNISAGNCTVGGLIINGFSPESAGIHLNTEDNNRIEGCWIGTNASGTMAAGNGYGVSINFDSGNNFIGSAVPGGRNVISGNSTYGIVISNSVPRNTIQNNYIGTSKAGTTTIPNGSGIYAGSDNNQIGGTAGTNTRNVISGNTNDGFTTYSTGNIIEGNFIGTNAAGNSTRGNGGFGVSIFFNSNQIGGPTAASRNVISGNNTGIVIAQASNCTVQSNFIGTDVTGTVGLGNTQFGINFVNDSQNTTIGGLAGITGQPPGNLISDNGDVGILVGGGSGGDAVGSVIQGNLIGTDITGNVALGNKNGGIRLGEPNVTIGGRFLQARNVISGNIGSGISVSVAGGHIIQGNFIGIGANGSTPLGNVGFSADGVALAGTFNNAIGGQGSGARNIIAHNGGRGISVFGGTGNQLLQNSIFNNGDLGIDLMSFFGPPVTPNDLGDADTGSNDLQNFPVLTELNNNGGNWFVKGSLNSIPNKIYRIEFFANDAIDPSGHGEGQSFLAWVPVTTDASGNAFINTSIPPVGDGRRVAATATDPDGNTSEFSAAFPPIPPPTPTPSPTPTATATPTPSLTPGVTPTPTPPCTELSEGFDAITTLPGAGWVQTNHSELLGPTGWFQGNSSQFPAHSGAPTSYIAADNNNASGFDDVRTISNWLLTPPLTLQNGATMTFWTRQRMFGNSDRLQVRMSTNGASTNVGTTATDVGDFIVLLLEINQTQLSTGYPEVWTPFTVTLSGIGSPTTGRLAFRYFVTNAQPGFEYIGIDTFQFSCTPPVGNYQSDPFPGGTLNFGNVAAGTSNHHAQTLLISNNGDTPLQIRGHFNFTGFGIDIIPDSASIPARQNVEVQLDWNPITDYALPRGLELIVETDDPATPVARYRVLGEAFHIFDSGFEGFIGGLFRCLGCTPPTRGPQGAILTATVTDGATETDTLIFDPAASQGLTAEIPSFLGGGSVQLSNFSGSVTVSLHPIPNDPEHKRIRIDGGTMTAPSVQLPGGPQTGLNRLTFGSADESDGILQVADGSYTASGVATIVNDLLPDGVFVRGNYAGVYNAQTGKISVQSQSEDSFPARGQLLNISTRMQVLPGDRVLIGGFIITGTDPKKVIIRGIGPSLGGAGGALPDPTLELFQGNTQLARNDNWKTRPDGSSQQAEIEATTIPPTNDLESALVATLNPGVYTVILAGKGQASGLGVVELYDLAQGASSKLANISSRGFVDTGDNIMIGGVIVGGGLGGGDANVIIRAIGPSLSGVGVSGALQDPTLELRDGNGAQVSSNDNWKLRPDGSSQQAEIEATTIPPSDDRESALVASLPPGNHTAIVRGVNNTIGIAVVEVYNIP